MGGKKKRQSTAKVIKRREKVKRYYVRGYSYREMGELLEVSHVQIKNDVDAVIDEIIEAIKSKEGQSFIAETALAFREIERAAWQGYHGVNSNQQLTEAQKENMREKYLHRAESAREKLVKVLQSLEVVVKAPEKMEISTADKVAADLLNGIGSSEN